MTNYKKILVAADLIAKDDDPVAEKALEIGQATGAELHLIHVIEQHTYSYGTPFVSASYIEWQAELEKTAAENLAKLGEKMGVPEDRLHLPTGQAKGWILDVADTVGVDLIIVGSHGRHGLDLLLLGSTANGVLHSAKCDVLAVRVNLKKG